MPSHMIVEDLRQGWLVRLDLDPTAENAFGFRVPLACAHLRSRTLGPAGRWLFQRLMADGAHPPPQDG
ncbi:hypothetical protein [Falsirhodobacter sp. 1013]|uniref:hypothetical protein n=1 Tax=Falsirhodobacter sp. 1013 TaxID=3417566 RepID=UPI003EBDC097